MADEAKDMQTEELQLQYRLLVDGTLKNGLGLADGSRTQVMDVDEATCPYCGRSYLRYTTQVFGEDGNPLGPPKAVRKDMCTACRLKLAPYGYWVATDPQKASAMMRSGDFDIQKMPEPDQRPKGGRRGNGGDGGRGDWF